MIKPMIDPAFSTYGIVEKFRREHSQSSPCCVICRNTEVPIYQFSYATSWDYVDGMTILVILDGETTNRFYLDRAVTIHPGVRFGFYTLGPESTISGDTARLESTAVISRLDISRYQPKIQPLNVFTLFQQTGEKGLFFRGESHPPLELVYLENGTLRNFCDGQELTLLPNELMLLGPNQWHMQYSDESVRFLTISFSWEGYDFSHLFNRVISATSELQHSIQSLIREYGRDLPERDEYLNAQIKLLLLQLLRMPAYTEASKKTSPASKSAHWKTLDKAMQIVSQRIYGKLTVSDLADSVNVSTSQLTALFRRYLDMSPAKYITRVRLEESKALLVTNELSVGEIADMLGYSSIQHFSKQFHSWYGYAPSTHAHRGKR